MFDWFGKTFGRRKYPTWDDIPPPTDMEKIGADMNKVIPFPEPKAVPWPAPEPEKPAKVFYRMGLTDSNRLAFSMGIMEITMSKEGVQNMIDQLVVFRDQLKDDDEE
jgi:hypothetical protein